MTERFGIVVGSSGRGGGSGLRLLCLVLLPTLAPALAEANSVTVEGETALGGAGFRLHVSLENPASVEPNDAWVGIGPERGMADETQVVGSFVIDPGELRMAPSTPSNPSHLCFLGLSETEEWTTARVILFLERGAGPAWLIGARVWDDDLGSYVGVGPAALGEAAPTTRRTRGAPEESGSGPSATLVDFEWRAASAPGARDGRFRLFRTVGESRELLLENAALSSGAQKLNHLRAGVVNGAHQARGTFGTLSLDEISLSRTFGPAEP